MTATHEVAFGRSYGSVDATPLFLIVLHAYFCWTADLVLLLELKDALNAATRWLLQYGDHISEWACFRSRGQGDLPECFCAGPGLIRRW